MVLRNDVESVILCSYQVQVFQRIDILSKDFDNIVELQLGTPWPIPPVEISATLAHKFEIIGVFSWLLFACSYMVFGFIEFELGGYTIIHTQQQNSFE